MDTIDNIFIIAIFGCALIAAGIVIGYGIYLCVERINRER